MSNINIRKAKIYQLDPSKKYLIVFDDRYITKEDARRVSEGLGIQGVAVMVPTAPGQVVKVIEGEPEVLNNES